jgi:hypothetical protein
MAKLEASLKKLSDQGTPSGKLQNFEFSIVDGREFERPSSIGLLRGSKKEKVPASLGPAHTCKYLLDPPL